MLHLIPAGCVMVMYMPGACRMWEDSAITSGADPYANADCAAFGSLGSTGRSSTNQAMGRGKSRDNGILWAHSSYKSAGRSTGGPSTPADGAADFY